MRFAEKFLFVKVDVLDLDIQFGLDTARQFEEITNRRNPTRIVILLYVQRLSTTLFLVRA